MSGHHPGPDTKTSPATTNDEWSQYHAATRNGPPRPLLVEAIARLPGPGVALDLGCGAGNDTGHLLREGFHVTAVNANLDAVRGLQASGADRLIAIHATFDQFGFDPAGYDLISAQYALPFNPPETFARMFARLVASLRPGGIFTGQLFGMRDAWNVPDSGMTFHSRDEAEALLRGLDQVVFREVEQTVTLVSGQAHQAHDFEIIARSPAHHRT